MGRLRLSGRPRKKTKTYRQRARGGYPLRHERILWEGGTARCRSRSNGNLYGGILPPKKKEKRRNVLQSVVIDTYSDFENFVFKNQETKII